MKGYNAKSKFNLCDKVKFKNGTIGKIIGIWDYTHESMKQGFEYFINVSQTNEDYILTEKELDNTIIGVYRIGVQT